MNTKELMIGDFVYCEPEGKVIQVTEVRGDAVQFHKRSALTAFEDELRPIPLTGEILGKNAEYYDNVLGRKWLFLKSGQYLFQVFRWENDDLYEICNCIEIRYVHELQHVLRLCGEYELADNLKLE